MGNLTANEVKAFLSKPGTYQDGDGLFLKVDKRGGASWLVRIQHQGKRRDYTIGTAKLVTLANARIEAVKLREAVRIKGRDPVAEKRKTKAETVSFKEAADAYLEAHKHQWANEKHGDQWLSTLKTYAFPALGSKPVGSITAGEIISAISEVWTKTPETGRRVKQRICTVLDYAHARGWRATEAPHKALAAGKGLPKQSGGKHHPAMPYADVPAFLTRLRVTGGVWGRLALEFAVLTAARSQEVRLATWDEFDLENALWTVPADHMKMRRGAVRQRRTALHTMHFGLRTEKLSSRETATGPRRPSVFACKSLDRRDGAPGRSDCESGRGRMQISVGISSAGT